jgi:hypothetical protein
MEFAGLLVVPSTHQVNKTRSSAVVMAAVMEVAVVRVAWVKVGRRDTVTVEVATGTREACRLTTADRHHTLDQVRYSFYL